MEPIVIVALITQAGIIISGILVTWAKSKLKLWERRGEDREIQRRNYSKLMMGYGKVYDEYFEILSLIERLKREQEVGNIDCKNVPSTVLFFNLVDRKLLPNILNNLEPESTGSKSSTPKKSEEDE